VKHSLRSGWTDVVTPDVFMVVARGAVRFRVVDLLGLTQIIDGAGEGLA